MRFLFAFLFLICVVSNVPTRAVSDMDPESGLDVSSGLSITFLGTSSFLVQTPRANILIDGYFTRSELNVFGGVKPNEKLISKALCQLGIALVHHEFVDAEQRDSCRKNTKRLDAVIPVHAHFDHALDAPLVAALTGAALVGDANIKRLSKVTKETFPMTDAVWKGVEFVDLEVPKPAVKATKCSYVHNSKQKLPYGDIQVTLFETPHSCNLASVVLEAKKAPEVTRFPTSIFSMKKGVSLSVHIEFAGRRMLILPTAGKLGSRIEDLQLLAEVLFLGAGGLNLGNKKRMDTFVENTILASQAQRVFPIHLDDFTKPIDLANPKVSFKIYAKPGKTRKTLQSYSSASTPFEVVLPLVGKAFDPFAGLSAPNSK